MSAKKNKSRPVATQPLAENMHKPVAENTYQESESNSLLKEETLIWILTAICTLAVYMVVALLIQKVYQPDIAVLKETAAKLLLDPGSVRPEPVEAMLFRAGVVVVTLGLVVFYSLFSRMKAIREQAAKPFFMFISGLCLIVIAGLIYFDFAAQNPFAEGGGDVVQNSRDMAASVAGKSNFEFYFSGMFLGTYVLVYTFVLVPLLACLFFFGIRKYKWDEKGGFKKGVAAVGYLVLGLTILAIVAMSAFYYPYSFENKYNFNAVYYSMTQVYSGAALLVDGFTNTYGLYPHFLNLIFKMTGLSVVKFTTVLGLLTAGAFIMNFFSLKNFVRNNVILFLGILTVIFVPFMDFKLGQNFDCNFAFYPIRYIIPSTLIIMAVQYLKNRKQMVYWLTTVIQAFFILWNPEIGVVCFLSWLAFNTFNDFYTQEGKIAVKKILFHWVAGIAVAVAAAYIYKGIIAMAYGSAPDLSLLFSTVLVFGKVGFNMLPMTAVHPWHFMALILILGFLYSISQWRTKVISPRAAIIFLVSVLGVGFFFYYQGRSHNWQLAQSSGMCLLLLTLLGDEYWDKIKGSNVLVLNGFFVVFLFFISFSFFELLFNNDRIREMVSQEDDKTKQEQDQKRVEGCIDFILKNSAEKERIYMVTAMQYQGLYFDGSKRRAAFNPGLMDMFTKADAARYEKQIIDSANKVFIEPAMVNYPSLIRPAAAIAATYELKAAFQGMAMLTKRQTKVPTKAYFVREGQTVHRKYSDDTAGWSMRINDAVGMAPVTVGQSFSLEALFFSAQQISQFAAIIGNMTDTTGFLIHNVINTPNYFFGVNGKGINLPVPANQWVYCVMNVFPDKVEVYLNGVLANSFSLPKPIRQSPEKLYIGNIAFMHYFMGAISEVAINNKPLEKSEVEGTWAQMKP